MTTSKTTKNSIYLNEKFQGYLESLMDETGLGKSAVVTMALKHYKEYTDSVTAMQNIQKLESLDRRIQQLENSK